MRYRIATIVTLLMLEACCTEKSVEMRNTFDDSRTSCEPEPGDEGGGPFGLPQTVCECVAALRALGWEPLPHWNTGSIEGCKRR